MTVIEEYHFGVIRIDGETYRNDVKIVGGQVVPKWWRRRGHVFDERDVRDILAARPEALVCGTGSSGMARVSEPLARRLEEDGVALHALPTAQAVELFNRLEAEGRAVAGAFHLTC
ncbi:MTH938/NDUFAF3 family protein [Desulfocurvus sp.]|jgi:hypothetical protein|uniref:Mth938-like domain-containing protein n=1 Tax=Desulfocurvus sp. TaxID=2871698 RepID=UPI0025C653D8|nr:MTH938/NDUFAF3 family protein [Desulfocurvus sp.]MCK9239353.1 MTH938/NDUFAF3 family protein [Desulfocurvus sp.]